MAQVFSRQLAIGNAPADRTTRLNMAKSCGLRNGRLSKSPLDARARRPDGKRITGTLTADAALCGDGFGEG